MYTQSLSVSAKVFLSLKKQGLDPLVVQQCRFLEQAFNTIYTFQLKHHITVYMLSLLYIRVNLILQWCQMLL